MNRFRGLKLTTASLALGALALTVPASAAPSAGSGGMPVIHVMGLVNGSNGNGNGGGANGGGSGHKGGGTTTTNLTFHGGAVQTAPKVYLVFWGSQWNNNDPSGEATLLGSFFSNVGGSSWNNTVTQYCQGVSSGTIFCNGAGTAAGNQSGMYTSSNNWYDNATAAPSHPTQSQLAAEAVRAATHFATSVSSFPNAQFVIATATGNSSSGFGTQYCAWHSSTSSTYGNIAYTNLPYITDAGSSCGANFNGLGANAGITIVGGHEFAETETDPFPSSGWVDSSGYEIGDKCAWSKATTSETLNNSSFAVQPLWSNASTGCALSYP